MDDTEFKARASRLEQIAKVLEKLPPEVRTDAFDLLKGFVTEHSSEARTKKEKAKGRGDTAHQPDEEFFTAFEQKQPADNAKLIAAWFYREYGVEPFSLDDVRAKASGVGLTIPARVDMTFVQAMEKGKKLFARAGTGKFKPTVYGEANLKRIYSVKKGTKKRVGDGE